MVSLNPSQPTAFLRTYADASLVFGTVQTSPLQIYLSSESSARSVVGKGSSLADIFSSLFENSEIVEENLRIQVNVKSLDPSSRLDILHYHGMQTCVLWNPRTRQFDWDVLMRRADYRTSFSSVTFNHGFLALERKIDAAYLDITRNAVRHVERMGAKKTPADIRTWFAANFEKARAEYNRSLEEEVAAVKARLPKPL